MCFQASNATKPEGTSLSSPTRNPNASKQLQLQFVLDCKMIDPKTKQEITAERAPNTADTTSTLKPYANHHNVKGESNENFGTTPMPRTTKQLSRTTTPWYKNPIIIQSIMQTQTPHTTTTEKLKVKNVYVDPPGISEIGNAFEGFYDFFEDTFTEEEKDKNKRRPVKKSTRDKITIPTGSPVSIIRRPIPTVPMPYVSTQKTVQMPNRQPITYSNIRYPVNNRYKRTTLYPNRKIVPQYVSVVDPQYADDPNDPNNFLTTKIHVTSQYGGPKPTASMNGHSNKQNSDDSSEEYYYDTLALNNLAADDDPDSSVSREEEEEEDGDDDDDDDTSDTESDEENIAEENVEYPIPTDKTQKKQRKRKNKDTSTDNSEDYSYENADYDFTAKIGSYGESMGNFFSSVGEYIPRLPSFGRQSVSDEDENRGVSTVKGQHKMDAPRITTPHSEYRHPKQPSDNYYGYDYSKSVESNKIESDADSSWFNNNFFFGSNEDTIATPTEIVTTTDSSSYFDWFGSGSNEEKQSSEESSSNGNISSK